MTKSLQFKWLKFNNWKELHNSYYINCEVALLRTMQSATKVDITSLVNNTNFADVYEKEFFTQIFVQGKVDIDYLPFINFAKKFKYDNLTVM